ncbi:hypothetical protein ECP03019043_2225 [Escherichia coli P0301904.3]|nr:hypothetical protein ECP03019043_2225 [Escherichia coli P0301904.3]
MSSKCSSLRSRLPEIKTTDSQVSDESDIHSIMLEKSAKAESKAPQESHKGR